MEGFYWPTLVVCLILNGMQLWDLKKIYFFITDYFHSPLSKNTKQFFFPYPHFPFFPSFSFFPCGVQIKEKWKLKLLYARRLQHAYLIFMMDLNCWISPWNKGGLQLPAHHRQPPNAEQKLRPLGAQQGDTLYKWLCLLCPLPPTGCTGQG